MLFLLFPRDVACDMSEFRQIADNTLKYFEFLAYLILGFVLLQLIVFVGYMVSVLSVNDSEEEMRPIVHPIRN